MHTSYTVSAVGSPKSPNGPPARRHDTLDRPELRTDSASDDEVSAPQEVMGDTTHPVR